IHLPAIERFSLSRPAPGVEVLARRGNSRYVSRPATQATRDRGAAEVSGGFHYWNWLAVEGRLSSRNARRRLRRLGYRYSRSDRQRHAWAERRHPGLEPRYPAAP